MTRGLWGRLASALGAAGAFLWLPFAFGAPAAAVPEERILYRDIVGTVADEATGKPVPGIPVSLLYETVVTDEAGAFRFEKVPLSHTAQVSLRVKSRKGGYIIGCMTVDVPVRFYPLAAATGERVAVVVVDPADEAPVQLKLKTVPSAKVDDYCSTCHDSNPCLETGTYQEVVQSGKDLRGIIVYEDEVEEFTKRLMQQGLKSETYQKIRYQDSHPDGMNMEVIAKLEMDRYLGRYKRPKSISVSEEKYVTCDTCHTRHVPTPQKQYIVMPYEQESSLCYECHL